MMKQIVVLVLLVVLVLCFTSDARRTRGGVRRVRKCIERENTRCRYARKCVKAATKCVQRKRVKHCARFGTRRIAKRVTRKVCLKVRGGKASKKCLRCAKWGTKTVRKYSTKKVCVRHVTRTSCTKHKNVCVRHATKRVCSVVEPKIIVTGPKRCRRGFSLKFKKTGRRVRRFCKRNPVKPRVYTLKTCSSYLDPHTTGFDGRNFEFQVEGDFLMAETSDGVFSLHQRLKRFGGYTGTVAMAVRVNGVDVLEYLGSGRFLLNGKSVNVANGVALGLPNSGSVKKTGNVITVESPNGAKAVYTEYGQAANLVAFVPSDLGVKGYCSGTNLPFWMKNTASGLFHDKLRVRFAPGAIPKPHFTKRAKRNARTRCRGQGLRGARLANCVHDSLILRNHPNQRRLMIHIVKRIKKQIRRARKIHIGKVRRIIRKLHRRARRFHRRAHRRARRHHARRHRRAHRRARRARRAARRAAARASGHGRRRGGWLRRALRRL